MNGVDVRDVPEHSAYEITSDGTLAGSAFYTLRDDQIVFTHTEVGAEFGGQGLGGRLARYALDDAAARGLHVVAQCPFIARHLAPPVDSPTNRRPRAPAHDD
ncbi:MAG: GNAT family N-acetyltransferase [Mycobacteriaceae bacterium]